MNLTSTIRRCVITLLLLVSIKWCSLLLAGCVHFNALGHLTVEPGLPFLMGSNLTVYCHVKKCQKWFSITLDVDGKVMNPSKRVNCHTAIFNLSNVRRPRSAVLCMKNFDRQSQVVNGLDLYSGLPPDKPQDIICETAKNSELIHCSWEKGQETHLPTTYNISLSRGNAVNIYLNQIQDAENISIPRAMFADDTKHQLIITAYNHFGASQSDPFTICLKDIVIPETPHIVQIDFGYNAIAVLQCKTESSRHLKSSVRLRRDNGYWEVREGTELSECQIRVDGLQPLTEYEFQMRTCTSASHTSTPGSTSSRRSLCSKWSPSKRKTSPGRGPSQLNVWRILGSQTTNAQMVTVLWKPPPPEDYSGEVKQYNIVLGNGQKEVRCPAALSHCSASVPPEVQTLSVSVVTLYGTSPPADVPLRHLGVFGPDLRELIPAANGSAVLITWSWSRDKHWSASGGELLHYVIEWTSVPAEALHWQKVDKDRYNASITGLTAGVRYNISLYAVTTRGVSAPVSSLVYSREMKPLSGPNKISVVAREARRVQIQWDELDVAKQRGFITKYTIYLQKLDSSKTEQQHTPSSIPPLTVSASGPRRIWLDCPGTLSVRLTASTSAGEGPEESKITCYPTAPSVSMVIIVVVVVITLFTAIVANLMCWSCVRQRIKHRCVSWGPSWLVVNLPKPGHSNAIRLLKQGGSEPSFSYIQSDPPLSPISLISQQDRDDVYPVFHVEASQADTPLLEQVTGTMLPDFHLEHVSYKPQTATFAPQEEEEVKEAEEEQRDTPACGEEDRYLGGFRGLFGGLLSSVEVNFSDSPPGLTLSSLNCLLWPTISETASVQNEGFRRTEGNEVDSSSVDLRQVEILIPDQEDTCVSQCAAERTLGDGYLPPVSAVLINTTCDMQT